MRLALLALRLGVSGCITDLIKGLITADTTVRVGWHAPEAQSFRIPSPVAIP